MARLTLHPHKNKKGGEPGNKAKLDTLMCIFAWMPHCLHVTIILMALREENETIMNE